MHPVPDSERNSAQVASAVRDARARILWGDPVPAVLDAMMEAGVEGAFARIVVDEAMKERGAEIRKSGIREVFVGAAVFGIGGTGFLLLLFSGMISMILVGGSLTVAAYGGFRLFRGLARLIAGPHAAIDVSDL